MTLVSNSNLSLNKENQLINHVDLHEVFNNMAEVFETITEYSLIPYEIKVIPDQNGILAIFSNISER
ncbi:hypothetical protein BED47_02310 [Gottfriedia luciferensis]|uniref:Uncharacterized protein n=1 Tax=Gottfriedia luciferensis TaxID=178774 RepID=A0ABX2ZXB4_9BACI|nr:hypothetical protein [Gottfriedia luciferensis]ODG94024.1 hypothetical protein BED47_02310 [Gottfriedia luciferensis]